MHIPSRWDNGKVKKTVTAENIVVAVGSEPAEIAAFNVDHKKVITSNEIMDFLAPAAEEHRDHRLRRHRA